MRIEHEQFIAAGADVVWRLTEDIERWPSITPTMNRVERLDDGPLHVGSSARISQPRQRPRVWTVTELDAPRRFAWSAGLGPVTMVATHLVEPVPDGCRNTLSVELSGLGSGALARLAGGQLRSALSAENEGFRNAAESAADDDR
jgi:hypothetical protein